MGAKMIEINNIEPLLFLSYISLSLIIPMLIGELEPHFHIFISIIVFTITLIIHYSSI